jgi:hypothetical protein
MNLLTLLASGFSMLKGATHFFSSNVCHRLPLYVIYYIYIDNVCKTLLQTLNIKKYFKVLCLILKHEHPAVFEADLRFYRQKPSSVRTC